MAKELTPKQAHFARCVAQGMTQADAYREAYDPKQSTAATIHTLASRVMARVEVRARVEALIKARERAVVASALSDRDKVLGKLRLWIDGTEETDSNRIRVAELLGRSSGLFATDINVTTKERDSSAVAAEIEQRLAALLVSTADASDALDDADAGGSIH
jgi:hypothetical protein